MLLVDYGYHVASTQAIWFIFVNIYSLFEIQNVIELNTSHAPRD